ARCARQQTLGPFRIYLPPDNQRLRPLSRHPLTAPWEVLQHFAVPQAHDAALEAPLAVLALYRVVVVPAGEAQGVGWLAFALGDESEAAHLDAAVVLRGVLDLGHVMLAAGEARRAGVVGHQAADSLVAFPDVGVFADLRAHPAVFGEAGDQSCRIAGVERPGVVGDQVLQAQPVLDRKLGQRGLSLLLPQP